MRWCLFPVTDEGRRKRAACVQGGEGVLVVESRMPGGPEGTFRAGNNECVLTLVCSSVLILFSTISCLDSG